ncbi:D-alanine--D-alanine ligase [Porticoccaceae bacterium]|jgi:D-alanine-D-alanine ligase|nr:D-alanine--D-alanine ligase [Cellvibrionales bacterium]MDA7795033.1 D-alanine--D-alanine ligase [Porticoccaceae bacterium]MDA8899116.1 D-alanine--D-alanine ligase [Porticoccaceae bacterium]
MTASLTHFGRVAVLYGGTSSEREISLLTGAAIIQALELLGVETVAIDIKENALDAIAKANVDRAFIALHGPGGEDGTLQGALEYLKIPYTGSGVMASALAMDKLRCKQLWKGIGLATTDFSALNQSTDWQATMNQLGGSVVVKPACEGSSVGMSIAKSAQQLEQAWQLAAQYDAKVLAEPQLTGDEYTVAILDGKALPSIRIQANATFYDYEAKYNSDKTEYFCPSGLDAEREQELAQLSIDAFNSIDGRGWGRVDVMADQNGRFNLLEVNTVPGMTSHSLVPMAGLAAGLKFEDVVRAILEGSL